MTTRLDRLVGVLLHNKWLKLAALVMATLTWMFIRDANSFEDVVRDIPLKIDAPEGWAIQEISAKTVSVTFRGSENDIRNLEKSQIEVDVNVRVGDDGPDMVIALSHKNVIAPRSVRALHVMPPEVRLTLDREAEKEVKVEVAKLGEPPEGYFIEDFSVSPDRVKIFGPLRRLAEIDSVWTEPLDLAGRIRSFSNNIALATPSGLVGARMDRTDVTVSFTITEFTVRRDINNVPVRMLLPPGASSNFRIKPSTVDLSLKGRVNVISNLSERAVQAFVDYNGMNDRDEASLPVEVTTTLPGVNVMIVDPPEVRVERTGTPR